VANEMSRFNLSAKTERCRVPGGVLFATVVPGHGPAVWRTESDAAASNAFKAVKVPAEPLGCALAVASQPPAGREAKWKCGFSAVPPMPGLQTKRDTAGHGVPRFKRAEIAGLCAA
jgi:hypothetical protein